MVKNQTKTNVDKKVDCLGFCCYLLHSRTCRAAGRFRVTSAEQKEQSRHRRSYSEASVAGGGGQKKGGCHGVTLPGNNNRDPLNDFFRGLHDEFRLVSLDRFVAEDLF